MRRASGDKTKAQTLATKIIGKRSASRVIKDATASFELGFSEVPRYAESDSSIAGAPPLVESVWLLVGFQ